MAMAGIPSSAVRSKRSECFAAPSSIEYSVCTWRCTNDESLDIWAASSLGKVGEDLQPKPECRLFREGHSDLLVTAEEIAESFDRLGQIARPGQRDDAQVVGVGPVETGPLRQQDLFGQQQIEDELLIVLDLIDLGVCLLYTSPSPRDR